MTAGGAVFAGGRSRSARPSWSSRRAHSSASASTRRRASRGGSTLASALGERPVARGDLVAACPDTAAVRRLGRYWTNGRCPGGARSPRRRPAAGETRCRPSRRHRPRGPRGRVGRGEAPACERTARPRPCRATRSAHVRGPRPRAGRVLAPLGPGADVHRLPLHRTRPSRAGAAPATLDRNEVSLWALAARSACRTRPAASPNEVTAR